MLGGRAAKRVCLDRFWGLVVTFIESGSGSGLSLWPHAGQVVSLSATSFGSREGKPGSPPSKAPSTPVW